MTEEETAKAVLAVPERLLWTVEHGDLEDLHKIFGEGAEVLHNTDDRMTNVEQTIKNLREIKANATEFRYVNVRRQRTPTGYVQQHELYVKTKDGREIHDHCCSLGTVVNGRIVHIDSYHDSAATPPIPGRKPGRDWRHEK
jgi:ketosteroid isomerase-like protein